MNIIRRLWRTGAIGKFAVFAGVFYMCVGVMAIAVIISPKTVSNYLYPPPTPNWEATRQAEKTYATATARSAISEAGVKGLFYQDDYELAVGSESNPGEDIFLARSFAALADYQETIRDLTEYLVVHETDVQALFERGDAYYKRAGVYQELSETESAIFDYNQAIRDYSQMIAINSEHIDAYTERGNSYTKLGQLRQVAGDYDQAISHYQQAIVDHNKAIELNPNSHTFYNNRGQTYNYWGELYHEQSVFYNNLIEYQHALNIHHQSLPYLQRAIEDFDKAITLNSNSTEFYINRGVTYYNLGLYSSPKKFARPPYGLDDRVDAFLGIESDKEQTCQQQEDEFDEASVIAFSQSLVSYTSDMSDEKQTIQYYEQAIINHTHAISLDDTSPFAYYNRAVAYSAFGDVEQALSDFKQAIKKRNSFFPKAYFQRGNLYLRINEYKKAVEDYNTVILQTKETHPLVFLYRADAHAGKQDFPNAVIDYTTYLDRFQPNSAESLYKRGTISTYRLGLPDDGLEDYEIVITLNPDAVEVIYHYGNAYARKHTYQEAIDYYDQYLAVRPHEDKTYYKRGLVYYERAQEVDYNQTDIYYSQGHFYFRKVELDDPDAEPKPTEYERSNADYEQAWQDFSKTIEANPTCALAYLDRANIRSEQALRDYTQAVALNADYSNTYFNLAKAYAEHAIQEYTRAIAANPHDAELFLNLANAYYEQAFADYNQAITLDANLVEAYIKRGNIYFNQRNYAKAHDDYRKAIDIDPENPVAYLSSGRVYHEQRQLELALVDYDTALELDETLAEAYYNRAYIYDDREDVYLQRALADYSQVFSLHSNLTNFEADEYPAYNTRLAGDIGAVITDDIERAVMSYEKYYYNDNPHLADAFYSRANALYRQNKLDEAISDYDQAIAMHREFAEAYFNRAYIYYEQDNIEQAIDDYRQAVVHDFDFAEAYFFLGLIYDELGQVDLAFENYASAISYSPDFAESYFNQARIHELLGNMEEASFGYTETFRLKPQIIEDDPEKAVISNIKLNDNIYVGDYNQSIRNFERFKTNNPHIATAYFDKGNSFYDTGDYGQAIKHYNIAISLDMNFAKAYYNRAFAYRNLGDYEQVFRDFDKYVNLNSSNPLFYYSRADTYQQLAKVSGDVEQYEHAIEDYTHALSLDGRFAAAYFKRGKINYALHTIYAKQAISDYGKAVLLGLKNTDIFYNRAEIYNYKLHDYPQAIRDYDTYIPLERSTKFIPIDLYRPSAFMGRGDALQGQGGEDDDIKAIQDYSLALALEPNVNSAYFYRGKVYAKLVDKFLVSYRDGVNAKTWEYDGDIPGAFDDLQGDIDSAGYVESDPFLQTIRDYTEALNRNPSNPQIYFERGNANYERSLAVWDTVIRTDAEQRIPTFLGSTLYTFSDPVQNTEQALADYEQAISLKPNFKEAYYNMADVYYKQANFLYETAEGMKFYEDKPVEEIAQYHEALEKYRQAILYYTEFVNLYVYNVDDYIEWVRNHQDEDDYQITLEKYVQEVDSDTLYGSAYFKQALSHFFLKEYQSAIDNYEIAKELNPEFSRTKSDSRFSFAYFTMGVIDYQSDRAVEYYEKAIVLDRSIIQRIDITSTRIYMSAFYEEGMEEIGGDVPCEELMLESQQDTPHEDNGEGNDEGLEGNHRGIPLLVLKTSALLNPLEIPHVQSSDKSTSTNKFWQSIVLVFSVAYNVATEGTLILPADEHVANARENSGLGKFEDALRDYTMAAQATLTNIYEGIEGNHDKSLRDYTQEIFDIFDKAEESGDTDVRRKAIEADPRFLGLLLARGKTYSQQGVSKENTEDFTKAIDEDYTPAINSYTQVLKADPSQTDLYFCRARTYQKRADAKLIAKRQDDALSDYNKSIDDYSLYMVERPDSANAYFFRAYSYHAHADIIESRENYPAAASLYDEAIRDYHQALAIQTGYVNAYLNLAKIHARHGSYQQSIGYYAEAGKFYNEANKGYSQVIAFEPENITAYFYRAKVYHNLAKVENDLDYYQQAINDFNRVVELDIGYEVFMPIYESAYFHLGTIYDELTQHESMLEQFGDELYDKAINYYTAAIELNGEYTDAYFNRGNIHYYQGGERGLKLAMVDYDRVAFLEPRFASVYNYRGRVFNNQGIYQKALDDYEQAILLNPNYANAYYNRGRTYYNFRDYAEAINNYIQALALDPTDSNIYYHRGRAYYKLRETEYLEQAIYNYNQALVLFPNDPKSYYQRGRAYQAMRNYDKALADYNLTLTLDIDFTNAYDSRGVVHAVLGDYTKAIEDFEKFIELSLVLPEYKKRIPQREEWIAELQTGRVPFDELTIEGINIEVAEGSIEE